MRRHILLAPLLLIAASANAADLIGLKIKEFGIEGAYEKQQSVVWLRVEAQNNTAQTQSALIRVFQADLNAFARPALYRYVNQVTLPPSAKQIIDAPLRLANSAENSVLYAEALSSSGLPLGHAAQLLPHQTEGKLVGLLCANEAVCKSIRQTILFSGTPEEQTRKAQDLHLIQMLQLPPVWWAYLAMDTVVIARPPSGFSKEETSALEAFALGGGRLVLAEKEMGGSTIAGTPFASNAALTSNGLLAPVGGGTLVRVSSINSADFSNYFRPYGFAASTPADVEEQYARFRSPRLSDPQAGLVSWLHWRTSTQFEFPGLLELLLWMAGYLFLMVAISFLLLRRLGKPELAWVTIPVLAILFSVILYKVNARNRPTEYALEEARYYQLDGGNTLALAESEVQISAPRKGSVRLSAPGDFVYAPPQGYVVDSLGAEERPDRGSLAGTEIKLGESWESQVFLRVWSSRNLSFKFTHRFPGSVTRAGENRILNATGVGFEEAMLVTHDTVYLLGPLAAGGVADLNLAMKIPYRQISGHSNQRSNWLTSPSFAIGFAKDAGPERDFPNGAWSPAPGEPISLLEIVRGWPMDADRVFIQTKAVFFGKGKDVVRASSLADLAARSRSAAVYSVTYRDWK